MKYAVFSDFFPDANLEVVDTYEEAIGLYNDKDLVELAESNGSTIYMAEVIKKSVDQND